METVTVKQLQAILHLSANGAYTLCRRPGFPVVRVGRKILIPTDLLRDWMKSGGYVGKASEKKEGNVVGGKA